MKKTTMFGVFLINALFWVLLYLIFIPVSAFIGKNLHMFGTAVNLSLVNRIYLGIFLAVIYAVIPIFLHALAKNCIFCLLQEKDITFGRYKALLKVSFSSALILIGSYLIWELIGRGLRTIAVLFHAAFGILFFLIVLYPLFLHWHVAAFQKKSVHDAIEQWKQWKKLAFMFAIDAAILAAIVVLIPFGFIIGQSANWMVSAQTNTLYQHVWFLFAFLLSMAVLTFNQYYIWQQSLNKRQH